jgi:methyl coenzyme M reductase subunit C-like uncharacterized protein (methanogenesis marker protein 7)
VRLVAVLGYSGRRHHGLHDVCAERLRHAEELAADGDTVLLSGWARHRNGTGEAELMRDAWSGREVALVSDSTARNTRENAAEVAETARRLGADEVVVVTSRWHAPRARTLVRAALHEPRVCVQSSSPPGSKPMALLARELVCLAALPYHLLRLRTR